MRTPATVIAGAARKVNLQQAYLTKGNLRRRALPD
jgi:hypothetical protein